MKFLLVILSILLFSAPAYADLNDLPAVPAGDIKITETGIDWGNGFITQFGANGTVTKNANGDSIKIIDGKLVCVEASGATASCDQFSAYNNGLVEQLLAGILPAAGGPAPTPVIAPIAPETVVLVNGDTPTIQQNVVNTPTAPVVPVVPQEIRICLDCDKREFLFLQQQQQQILGCLECDGIDPAQF